MKIKTTELSRTSNQESTAVCVTNIIKRKQKEIRNVSNEINMHKTDQYTNNSREDKRLLNNMNKPTLTS